MNKVEMLEVLKSVEYKDWAFTIGQDQDRLYLQVAFKAADNHSTSKIRCLQTGRKWMLSEHMTKSELVQTAFKAVLTAEEHETREQFRYMGQAIFGPHFDVDHLVVLAITKGPDARASRDNFEDTLAENTDPLRQRDDFVGYKCNGRAITADEFADVLRYTPSQRKLVDDMDRFNIQTSQYRRSSS